MKFVKKNLIVVFISVLLFLIILYIFRPIFTATNLIFPYSVSKFDIALEYPIAWKYIKITYCVNCFITIYLLINSSQKFLSINKVKIHKKTEAKTIVENNQLNILLGTNEYNNQNIFISEKSLYQNILVTGTIGSRKDCLCDVSYAKTINGL